MGKLITADEIRAAWTFLELAALAGSMEVAISLPIPAWTMDEEGCGYGEYGYGGMNGYGFGDGQVYGRQFGDGEGYGDEFGFGGEGFGVPT